MEGIVDVTATHRWWDSFKKRHPKIVPQHAEPLSRVSYFRSTLRGYFEGIGMHPNGLKSYLLPPLNIQYG